MIKPIREAVTKVIQKAGAVLYDADHACHIAAASMHFSPYAHLLSQVPTKCAILHYAMAHFNSEEAFDTPKTFTDASHAVIDVTRGILVDLDTLKEILSSHASAQFSVKPLDDAIKELLDLLSNTRKRIVEELRNNAED